MPILSWLETEEFRSSLFYKRNGWSGSERRSGAESRPAERRARTHTQAHRKNAKINDVWAYTYRTHARLPGLHLDGRYNPR